MEALGTVQDISHTGMLVVRGSFAPRPGSKVLDHAKREVGRVRRVFGPVKAPYVSVKPSKVKGDALLKLLDKRVYADRK